MKEMVNMQKIFIVLLSIMVFSCSLGKSAKTDEGQKYLYIEASGDNASGEYRIKIDTTEIIAKNDSLAYLIAYEKACISKKGSELAAEELKKISGGTLGNYESIHNFQLLNENYDLIGKNVVPDSVLAEIEKNIFSIKIEDQ